MKSLTKIQNLHIDSQGNTINNEFYIQKLPSFKGENKYYWIWETNDVYYFNNKYQITYLVRFYQNYIDSNSYAYIWLYAHDNGYVYAINTNIFSINFSSKNWKNKLSNVVHNKMKNNKYKKDFSYVFDNIIIKEINHKMLNIGAL